MNPKNTNNIYEKNKNDNKEKIQFFDFLMYSTKAEIAVTNLQLCLYWLGITEVFVFLMALILFFVYPSQFALNLIFLTHVARAAIGFIILQKMPRTQMVIEQLQDFEKLPLKEINSQIISSYKKLLMFNSKIIRKLVIVYWILSGVNVIIDLIIFFTLMTSWGRRDYNFKNIFSLVLIVILFSKF